MLESKKPTLWPPPAPSQSTPSDGGPGSSSGGSSPSSEPPAGSGSAVDSDASDSSDARESVAKGADVGRPLFAAAEESHMVKWLAHCAAQGLIVTHDNFVDEVYRIVQMEQRGTKKRDEVAEWTADFQRRRSGELAGSPAGPLLPSVEAARRAVRPAARWYRSVAAVVARRCPAGALDDPRRVLCLDEVNLRLDPAAATVVSVRTTPAAADADNVAYVVTVAASGDQGPPMVVVPANGLVRNNLDEGEHCFTMTTRHGCVTTSALMMYIVKSLEPYLVAQGVPRPVLLYVDGLRHHCSMALSQFCDDEGIVLVGLPPAGQARNPVAAAFTSLLSANFDRLTAEARLGRRKTDRRSSASLSHIVSGIRQATRRVCKQTIAQAFASSGLFPWAATVVAACEQAESTPSAASPALKPTPVSNSAPAAASSPALKPTPASKSTPAAKPTSATKSAPAIKRPASATHTAKDTPPAKRPALATPSASVTSSTPSKPTPSVKLSTSSAPTKLSTPSTKPSTPTAKNTTSSAPAKPSTASSKPSTPSAKSSTASSKSSTYSSKSSTSSAPAKPSTTSTKSSTSSVKSPTSSAPAKPSIPSPKPPTPSIKPPTSTTLARLSIPSAKPLIPSTKSSPSPGSSASASKPSTPFTKSSTPSEKPTFTTKVVTSAGKRCIIAVKSQPSAARSHTLTHRAKVAASDWKPIAKPAAPTSKPAGASGPSLAAAKSPASGVGGEPASAPSEAARTVAKWRPRLPGHASATTPATENGRPPGSSDMHLKIVKTEQLSPTASAGSSGSLWESDRDESDAELAGGPERVVLPQSRLLDYLEALDAAQQALEQRRQTSFAAVVVELRGKLRALHSVSSKLSADEPTPAPTTAAAGSVKAVSEAAAAVPADNAVYEGWRPDMCAVRTCARFSRSKARLRLHLFPREADQAAVWLRCCDLPASALTERLGVCHLHFAASDFVKLQPPWSPDTGRRAVKEGVVPHLNMPTTANNLLPFVSPAVEPRPGRGVKRPKRFDDYQQWDEVVALPTADADRAAGAAAGAAAGGAAGGPASADAAAPGDADMTELANKQPAALKAIIRILRDENRLLRASMQRERRRGGDLAQQVEQLARDYILDEDC